jgi:hypothetical protein
MFDIIFHILSYKDEYADNPFKNQEIALYWLREAELLAANKAKILILERSLDL